jgi:glycosyltransferase involved in cell wall biosynthesis
VSEEPEGGPAGAVAIAYIHQDEVLYSWHHSLIQLLDHDLANNVRIWSGGFIAMRCGTDGLAQARNNAVREFLKDAKADWLWWVDCDMGFMPDTVDRLLEAADPVERPVMGALTFANREVDNDGMGGRRALAAPVIMHWTHVGGEAGFDTRWDYPRDTVVRCDGVGAACVLIHRSVFEKVAERYGPNWYTRAPNPSTGEMISEDLSFCARMMALGIPVHVHTGVPTTHAKRFWLAEEDYWRQRALNAAPETVAQQDAPRDWTVPRYAIIPTHNRPHLLTALVASLGRQCDRIVVLDNASAPPADEEQLQSAAGVPVLVLGDEEQPPHLSRFWNVLLDHIADEAKREGHDEYDVAILNDDSVVPAGWYNACATALRGHDTAVIAHTAQTSPALLTDLHNDPGNRMCPHAFVIRGELGMRADEDMRWWWFDTDLDLRARRSGGVLSVAGPRVVNARANSTTVGVLADQAQADGAVFAAKWSQ